jgi:Flp pilus assembly secretin CpaC
MEHTVTVFCTRARAAATVATFALLSSRVPASADAIAILSLQTGHSIVLNTPGLTRIAVGDGKIAGVVPVGKTQIVVNGKSPGHTTIFVWSGDNHRQTFEVTVTEQSFDDIAKVLRAAIDEPNVQVVAFNANLIVRGTVADGAAFAHLNDVIDRFRGIRFSSSGGGGGNGVIVNAVAVARPLGTLADEIAKVPGSHALRVDADAKGNVIVSGSVSDAADAQAVLDRVRGLAGPYLSSDGKVIDRIATDQTSQVDVKVYVLEVDRTASSQLGLRLQTASLGSGGSGSVTVQGQSFGISGTTSLVGIENPNTPSIFGKGLNIGSIARATYLAPTLDLMLSEGHARILSAPNLTTTPGKEATFLVGGEIPIPVSNGLGTVSISYKEYGVKLNVTPQILGNGGVDTMVTPEISDLDFADGVTLNGFVVPAFKTSKLSTDVITHSGESIVMGGLLRRMESKNVQKIPLLGDIPILGELFRSTSYQRADSDVVFVMTPTIVTQ